MGRWKILVEKYPVLSFILLAYGITWTVWLCIPSIAGDQWALVKILTGLGLGPGLAAVLLDRVRGMAGSVRTGRWWGHFSWVFLVVSSVNLSALVTGDAMTTAGLASAEPVGLIPLGVAGSLLAAACCGFIFASAATSRSRTLSSITAWRAPLRWWLIALLLPAALHVCSLGALLLSGEALPSFPSGGLPFSSWMGVSFRAILFTFLVVTVGEEPGWRGWMLPELQKRFSPLISTLILGVVWGLWHLPLFINGLYPGGPSGIFFYLVMCPVLAVIFTWLYNRTGGNLLLALVLHMAINNTSRLLPSGPSLMWWTLAFAVTLVFLERMWRQPSPAAQPHRSVEDPAP